MNQFDSIVAGLKIDRSDQAPSNGCTDCVQVNRYHKMPCHRHQCQAIKKKNGHRCKMFIAHGRENYCAVHGCIALLSLAPVVVYCDQRMEDPCTNRCWNHSQELQQMLAARGF